jgi:hypothetical protein
MKNKRNIVFWVVTFVICGATVGIASYYGLKGGDSSSVRKQAIQTTSQTKSAGNKIESMPNKDTITVYVTRTGHCYHRASCSYLRQSCIPMDLDQAKRRYRPCSRCNPPR